MPQNRPNDLDLRPGSNESRRGRPAQFVHETASPRTGEVPPALSPLDAFAMQSRILAKRFEEKQNGRRLSRLPPLEIQNELARRVGPGYSRSAEREGRSPTQSPNGPEDDAGVPHNPREVMPEYRPISHHPTIQSGDYDGPASRHQSQLSPLGEEEHTPPKVPHQGYFSIPRATSPESIEPRVEEPTPNTPSSRGTPTQRLPNRPHRTHTGESVASTGTGRGLMPPRSPGFQKSPRPSPSIRSVRNDSGDDGEGLSLGGSFDSLPPRGISSNTSYSRSHSPTSPYPASLTRSPSVASDYSFSGAKPIPAFNFSRPMSNNRRPSDARSTLEPNAERSCTPSRQASGESSRLGPLYDRIPSRQGSGDSNMPYGQEVSTPISMTSEGSSIAWPDHYGYRPESHGPAPSYIYARYDLPRGRTLDRQSMCASNAMDGEWNWERGVHPAHRTGNERPPSPPSPPKTSSSDSQGAKPKSFDIPRPSSPSIVSSNSTIKANATRPSSSGAATATTTRIADMTPQMHLEKGIEFHQKGEVQKATYHWRLAAKAEIPTAMLLYALACRHGWGMRPNQAEGVKWLRKAVDAAQLEVADDEDNATKGKPGPDVVERRTHKAQFAVSVYELGVSYMNGWGIQQDRSLALRCFEIAGSWGDADALAEAGFCYHEGIGCKKDLKKSARFYRMAEAKGVSVAGNSWIYKDKYKDDDDAGSVRGRSARKDGDKKSRDKSRTRTIFHRKKSNA
ncbi:hypothetical protein IWX90DRAFT_254504 [Phyllosticta citrichinensis]|uniref:Uncharacterized protein n=1 Tax=Phyllosticta citrichinensis TaxID=1130410 RepID=A0ABR1XRU5_9PEZI